MKIDCKIKSLSTYCENRGIPIKYFYKDKPLCKFTNIPRTPDVEIHWHYQKYLSEIREYTDDLYYVTELKNTKIFAHNDSGATSLVSEKNELIKSVSTRYEQESIDFKKEKVEGDSVLLSVDSAPMYFHWMYHVLPRIDLLNQYEVDWSKINKIILPKNCSSKFHKDSLRQLKIPESKILKINKGDSFEFENLIIPSRTGKHIFLPNWIYGFLKTNFLKKEKKHHDKIYISREKTNTRNVNNEEEVFAFLKRKGFYRIYLEDHDVFAQADIFNSAKQIVCPHGSGLTNLVYCEAGTKVCEFFSPNYVLPLYWSISNDLNLEYSYLIGEGDRPPKGKDPHLGRENITVKMGELEKLIKFF